MADRQSFGPRRRGPSLHPRRAAGPPGADGLHGSAHHLHELHTSAHRRRRPLRPALRRPSGIDRRDDRALAARQLERSRACSPSRAPRSKSSTCHWGARCWRWRKSRNRTVDSRQSDVSRQSRVVESESTVDQFRVQQSVRGNPQPSATGRLETVDSRLATTATRTRTGRRLTTADCRYFPSTVSP